jgi:anti-sigma regulatory factor (Ser/Thr protein kinase)
MRSGTVPTVPNRHVPWDLEQRPTSTWPLISYIELRATLASVPLARRRARAAAVQWGLQAPVDDVELTVSELVTNAVEAALRTWPTSRPTPLPVRLWLASDLEAILVQVWDSSPEMPRPRVPRPDEERGRGLLLVADVSRAWGMYWKAGGKVIWVVI